MEHRAVLELKNITKTFPSVKALDNVSLTVKAGTVHALMGENGAGKSTLMKCAFGYYHPDSGDIIIDGKQAHLKSTRDAIDLGIAMVHQELQVVRSRNVMENIWIGRIPYKRILGIRYVDTKKMYEDTAAIFKDIGVEIPPEQSLSSLSVSYCQLIEIAKAVSCGAKVIIMDEPTSSLSEKEAELLFAIIHKLTAQGVAIIYISHKIDEILQISDEVSIMRDGQMVGCWPASELDNDTIIARMVGRALTNRFPPKGYECGDILLEVENLTAKDAKSFKNVSFCAHRGEILGIGGLVGAQRTELVEALFGLRKIQSGTMKKDGKELNIRSPQDAIHQGFALLTEERRVTGIIPMLSIMDNTVLANQTTHRREYVTQYGVLDQKKRKQESEHYVEALSVKTPSIYAQIQNLSGGNQQKVLLGRWLLTDPDVLILDEPTRGIDVGAKYEIYSILTDMAKQGKSIIVVCSEMPELMGISDRIMVMCEGRVSGIIDGKTATEESIMRLASAYVEAREA